MRILKNINYHFITISLMVTVGFTLCISDIRGERRQRPDNIKNTDEYLENTLKEIPVKLTYIKSGAIFNSSVYYYSDDGSARIQLGTAELTLSGNHYTLNFKSAHIDTRKARYRGDGIHYNPWTQQNIANDFVQRGKFETFKKNNKYYIRFFDGDSDNYISEIQLQNADAKSFVMAEDGLSFEFTYK